MLILLYNNNNNRNKTREYSVAGCGRGRPALQLRVLGEQLRFQLLDAIRCRILASEQRAMLGAQSSVLRPQGVVDGLEVAQGVRRRDARVLWPVTPVLLMGTVAMRVGVCRFRNRDIAIVSMSGFGVFMFQRGIIIAVVVVRVVRLAQARRRLLAAGRRQQQLQ